MKRGGYALSWSLGVWQLASMLPKPYQNLRKTTKKQPNHQNKMSQHCHQKNAKMRPHHQKKNKKTTKEWLNLWESCSRRLSPDQGIIFSLCFSLSYLFFGLYCFHWFLFFSFLSFWLRFPVLPAELAKTHKEKKYIIKNMFEKSSLWPFAGAILDSRGKGGQIAKTIKTCKKMKKTREGFGKKLLLAIHQDNSRGKEEKYQKRKNWEKKLAILRDNSRMF